MADTTAKKTILRSLRDALRWVAHFLCSRISRLFLWLGGVVGKV